MYLLKYFFGFIINLLSHSNPNFLINAVPRFLFPANTLIPSPTQINQREFTNWLNDLIISYYFPIHFIYVILEWKRKYGGEFRAKIFVCYGTRWIEFSLRQIV